MLVPHFLKIYFGLGWPSSVLEIEGCASTFNDVQTNGNIAVWSTILNMAD